MSKKTQEGIETRCAGRESNTFSADPAIPSTLIQEPHTHTHRHRRPTEGEVGSYRRIWQGLLGHRRTPGALEAPPRGFHVYLTFLIVGTPSLTAKRKKMLFKHTMGEGRLKKQNIQCPTNEQKSGQNNEEPSYISALLHHKHSQKSGELFTVERFYNMHQGNLISPIYLHIKFWGSCSCSFAFKDVKMSTTDSSKQTDSHQPSFFSFMGTYISHHFYCFFDAPKFPCAHCQPAFNVDQQVHIFSSCGEQRRQRQFNV